MPLVLLHGWGKSSQDYSQLTELLSEKFAVSAPDLPGFGKEPVKIAMDLADYASWLAEYLRKRRIDNAVFVGHSFGGRVAIKTALLYPVLVEALVLIDSGGIERKNWVINSMKSMKLVKSATPEVVQKVFRQIFGSKDYLKASGLMRETLKKVVAENLEFELPKINTPTLVVWGREDNTTPLWQGELMHKLIQGSELKVIEGDHGIPYRRAEEVAKIIREYLEQDKS